jgi:hypothetical protein
VNVNPDAEFNGIRVGSLVRIIDGPYSSFSSPVLVVCREFVENHLGEGDGVYWNPCACVVVGESRVWISVKMLEPIDSTQ